MKLLLSLVAVIFLQTCIVSASSVYLNTTAPCVASGLCDFTNSSTWNGNAAPDNYDDVFITFNGSPLVVFMSNTTVIVNSITLSGSITLNVLYSTLQSSSITWSGSSLVEATSSAITVNYRATGSTLLLTGTNFDCTTLGTLTITQANCTQSALTARTINITALTISGDDSEIYATSSTLIGSLYSYGDVQFGSLNIASYALFESNSNLEFPFLYISKIGATVQFHNTQIDIQTITASYQANITISQSQGNYIGSLACGAYNLKCMVYLDNVSLTLGGISNGYVVADNAVFLSLIKSPASFYEIITNPNAQVTINCSTTLSFLYSDIYVQAKLNLLYPSGVLSVTPSYFLTFVPITPGLCPISGRGKITLGTGSALNCDGALSIGSVQIQSSILNVTEVTVAFILHITSTAMDFLYTPNSAINGDLTTQGSLLIDSNSKLQISGDYVHDPINAVIDDISINFEYMPAPHSPVIKVHGEVHIASVNAMITIEDGFEGELLLVDAKEIKKASFKSVVDGVNAEHTLGPKVREEDKLYILTPEESDFEWISEHWIYFLIVCVVTFAFAILFARLMYKSLLTRNVTNIGTSLPAYISSLKFSKLTCCGKFELILFVMFYLPFFLEAAVLTLALAVLIPLGFVFGLIEHKFVHIWAILVFFIQVGGLLDLFADLVLLAKTSLWYIENQMDSSTKTDLDYLEGTDLMLWVIRVGLTFVSALVAIFLMFSLFTTLGRKLDTMSGKRLFSGGKQMSTPAMAGSAFFVVILLVVFWKILLIAMRVYLLFIVLKSLIQKGKLEEAVQKRVQWVEAVLYLDLMWSGLPLGILTMFELFYFSEDFELGREQMFELLKLSALAVDLMGAAFLFWFIVVGLIKKIPALHHHDHHNAHASHAHTKVTIPNEKQPLIQHNNDAKH